MKVFQLIVIGLSLALHGLAQDQRIRPSANGKSIEFWSTDNKLIKTLEVEKTSPYAALPFKSSRASNTITYDVKGSNREEILNDFFRYRTLTQAEKGMLQPATVEATSDVTINNEFVLLSNHLYMYSPDGMGAIGIKSQVAVLNVKGEEVARLKENNDGYSSPVITRDGKYLAAGFGEIVPETAYTVIPDPGFRIYKVTTGNKLFEIPSSNKFDILPAMSFENYIIEVLQYENNEAEYLVFDFSTGTVYHKLYTSQELMQLKAYSSNGFIFLNKDGTSRLEDFKSFFEKSSFEEARAGFSDKR